jgi:hypothetical protein
MLRTFVFDDSKSRWIDEEHQLLSHDICAILDEEKEMIYLWNGPKSNKKKFKKGYKQIKEVVSNFPELSIQIIMVRKNFPTEIQSKVDLMLESKKLEKEKTLHFSRFTTIRIFSISIIIVIILPILSIINLSRSLIWPISSGIFQVNSTTYDLWIYSSKFLILISLFLFIINTTLGIFEQESQVIIFSLIGAILSFGLILYLNQGIYLFLFQEGSTLTNYLILHNDIISFLILNLSAILFFEIPNIYKLISFFKIYRKFIF